jgi:alkanesulfonate monooxygenase SsuD/methylene tetrahydromethanopterin reductase-like flavin-dependent oxidoreductase (luciferase family)
MFEEALTILVAGLTASRLSFDGRFYRYDDVPMELHPLQQPYPSLWYPTHNPESVQYAARHGTVTISSASARLRPCASMSISTGRPGKRIGMSRGG